MGNHTWTYTDDVVAFYLYRQGLNSLLFTPEKISEVLGMSVESIIARTLNFKHLAGGSGLNHVAQQSAEVYQEYKDKDIAEHKAEVMEILK